MTVELACSQESRNRQRVPGELLREPTVLAIAPYPVGVNDEIRETRCD
jgi:hypothetical protein